MSSLLLWSSSLLSTSDTTAADGTSDSAADSCSVVQGSRQGLPCRRRRRRRVLDEKASLPMAESKTTTKDQNKVYVELDIRASRTQPVDILIRPTIQYCSKLLSCRLCLFWRFQRLSLSLSKDYGNEIGPISLSYYDAVTWYSLASTLWLAGSNNTNKKEEVAGDEDTDVQPR